MKKFPTSSIEADDWRLQTTARFLGDQVVNGQEYKSGTRITVVSVISLGKKKRLTIPIPNATALLLSAAERAYICAHQIRDDAKINQSIQKEVSFGSEFRQATN